MAVDGTEDGRRLGKRDERRSKGRFKRVQIRFQFSNMP